MVYLVPTDPLALATLALCIGGTLYLWFSKAPKAYGMGLLILGVAGLQFAGVLFGKATPDPLGDDAAGDPVTAWLGLRTAPFLHALTWWTPFSYMFVHSGFQHLFGNMFVLLTAGPALEERIGSRRFLVIYLVAGFAAAAAHILLSVFAPGIVAPTDLALGASGAIFGVLTAFAIRYPRVTLPIPLLFIVWLPAFVVLLIDLAFNVAYLFSKTHIAWWGHFAGFLVGLAFATRLEKAQPVKGPRGLPDAEALRPLAKSRDLEELRLKIAQFQGDLPEDREFAEAWVEKFFAKARCPECGDALAREGLMAKCLRGHYALSFARKA